MTEKTFNKYKLVIDEWFINGFNGVKAYQKVYPKSKPRTAESNFRKILAITRISNLVEERRRALEEANRITIEECVSILTNMVRFDIKDLYDEHGALKSIHDIPEDTRMAIESLESDELYSEGFIIGNTKKIKTSSRRANAVELIKYLGGFEKHNSQKASQLKSIKVEFVDFSKDKS